MKQLRGFLLFLSCTFSLLLLQGGAPFIPSGPQAAVSSYKPDVVAHADNGYTRIADEVPDLQYFKSGIRRYNHRTRALNDYHELCLFVPSIRIKSLFVYIPLVYSGYKNSYISVAVTLSDWRGPPLA